MERRSSRYSHNIPAARALRRPLTQTEALLWERLRSRQMAGLKFRRQHAIGIYVLDFYCHQLRLVVEVDGGVHREPEQQRRDLERQALLEDLGLRFVRVTSEAVRDDLEGVVAYLLDSAQASGSPSPAKSGEGVGG